MTIRRTTRTLLLAVAGWVFIGALIFGIAKFVSRNVDDLTMTFIDVNDNRSSGDAAVLELRNGDVWMIDAGFKQFYATRVKPFLDDRGIRQIKGFVLTHSHRNHFEGLFEMLADGVEVDAVWFSRGPDDVCAAESWPGGCRVEHVDRLFVELKKAGVPVLPLSPGQQLFDSDGVSLDVLYQFTTKAFGIGRLTVNDTSPVMMLRAGTSRTLLTGDIGPGVGRWLVKNGKGFTADILQIPHHGLKATAPDAFFDAVAPTAVLVNGPAKLWQSTRGEQARLWAKSRGVPAYVTGERGNVSVRYNGNTWKIETERP